MSLPALEPRSIRFGSFEVDLRAGELRKHGIRIRLQDQPFQILALLLARPGELVSREELRRHLWPEGTFVDFDHSLNAAVKRLRAALGDDADSPRFVETLHRRGYRFITPIDARSSSSSRLSSLSPPASAATTLCPRSRLVVLPFANLSGDSDHDYFCDGLTEELITQLGRLAPVRLGVIARTSSMRFKGAAHSVADIAAALDVDFVLEGSIRCTPDRVRVTAQLIATRDESLLWTDSIDRPLHDVFRLQAEIAIRIASSLALELLPENTPPPSEESSSTSCEAHRQYLKGLYYWNKFIEADLSPAIHNFEEALRLDPEFPAALATLALAHVRQAEVSPAAPLPSLLAARDSATRALQLDPLLSDAHLAFAEIYQHLDHDWHAAEAAYRRSLSANPNSGAARRRFGLFLADLGRFPEAIAEIERACDLDPFCLTANSAAARVYFVARDFESALYQCRYALDLDPNYLHARRVLAAILLEQGLHAEAIAELERCLKLAGPQPKISAWLGFARARTGDTRAARSTLAELSRPSLTAYVSPSLLALLHLGLAEHDHAFAALSRAADKHDMLISRIRSEPCFDPLRHDPRFAALLHRLRFPS